MSEQPQSRSRRIIALGAGLALLIAVALLLADQLQQTSATSGGPEMRLTANGCTADCTFELGQPFTLAVEIVEAPSDGYIGAQSFLHFGTDLTYTLAAVAADEIVWLDCEDLTAVRFQFDLTLPVGTTVDYVVNHGCLTGVLTTPLSHYTGIFLELEFACSAEDSQTEVLQLPYEQEFRITTQETSGSAFALTATNFIIPKLTNLTIICGSGSPQTPAPTITPGGPTRTPTATPTPAPDVTATPTLAIAATPTPTATPELVTRPCGDVNGDGVVNSQDALWVLWLATGVINFVPFPDDLNGDGVVGPIDALLILQIEANLFICR